VAGKGATLRLTVRRFAGRPGKAKSQLQHLRAALSAQRQKADPAFSVAQTQQAA
jgi:hypothetical protein